MTKDVGTYLSGLIVVAALFTLVRRGSQGPALITSVTNGISSTLKAATGGGTF